MFKEIFLVPIYTYKKWNMRTCASSHVCVVN